MKPVVVDASALVDFLMRTDRAARVEAMFTNPDVDMHIPAFCDVEVLAGLRRAIFNRRLAKRHAALALEAYDELPMTRHGHRAYLPRMLALQDNFTAYDATYVALAEALSAELLTEDKKLATAARKYVGIA